LLAAQIARSATQETWGDLEYFPDAPTSRSNPKVRPIRLPRLGELVYHATIQVHPRDIVERRIAKSQGRGATGS